VTHTLIIPRWHPTSVNTLLESHWATRARLKRQDAAVVTLAARECRLPPAAVKRRVEALFSFPPGRRRFDEDAFKKVLLDSLVKCGLLRNDSPVWCETGGWRCVRAADGEEWGTKVELTDIS
jgi:hypothetical protein